jgi:hypothetical protein
MSDYSFLWRIIAEVLVRKTAAVMADRVFEKERELPSVAAPPEDPGYVTRVVNRELEKYKYKGVRTENTKDLPKITPFESEYGDAIILFIKRCALVRVHGKDAVYSHRDSLFELAATLKELEPRSGERAGEIAKFLLFIEMSLSGGDDNASFVAKTLCEMLSGDKAA